MYAQLKPEGLIRLQAGVKPLLKMVGTVALKGRQSALSPLRGCVDIPGLAGVAPLPVVLAPLRGCPCGLYKLFMFIYLTMIFFTTDFTDFTDWVVTEKIRFIRFIRGRYKNMRKLNYKL